MSRLNRIIDWYCHTPPDLPAGEVRIYTGVKIGYSAVTHLYVATILIFLSLDQDFLAFAYAAGAAVTAICFLVPVAAYPLVRDSLSIYAA